MTEKRLKRQSVLDLSTKMAKNYFLKSTSYCNYDLPPYLVFNKILFTVDKILSRNKLSSLWRNDPKNYDKVNHIIYDNKDGKYAWRPLQLIHPALYVSLVNEITCEKHWKSIKRYFVKKNCNNKIKCLSIPVRSLSKTKDKAEQISQWLEGIEQESISMSLDYDFFIHTDISDCYGSIYTHSIAWALHTKIESKKKENKDNLKLLGNIIDCHLRQMNYGQTNGIPQGSNLMDFIAEIVLGYADEELYNKLNNQGIKDYCILRYRDDYRIFFNNSQVGENVLKALTEVLIDLGLKLNATKTRTSSFVVTDALKSDKKSWIAKKHTTNNLLTHLMLIHDHAIMFPNSGSLIKPLVGYLNRIKNLKSIVAKKQIIAVIVDMAYRNPRIYPIAAAILSKLIKLLTNDLEKMEYINKIKKRFERIPNTGHMEIWLQRITLQFHSKLLFNEAICQLVEGQDVNIWCSDWISSKKLLAAVASKQIVDTRMIRKLPDVIPPDEIEIFADKGNLYY